MEKQGPPPSYSQQAGWSAPQPGVTPAQTYQPGQPTPGPAIIITSPRPVHNTPVGPSSSRVICPSCHADVSTNLRHEPTTRTHLLALTLFCFLCWPCVCLPYCMDSCQNANHYCPNCNAFIGTYQS